jgi:hypothetical protein
MRYLLGILLLCAACAQFDPIDPDLLTGAEGIEAAAVHPPDRERLEFGAYLLGFRVGRADFEFERFADVYTSRIHVEATGLAKLLYGGTLDAEGQSGIEDALSRRWTVTTVDDDVVKKTVVRFSPETGKILSLVREPDGIHKVETEVEGALDPLGSLYALRRADLADGASFRTAFFSREHPYRADSLVMGRERVEVPAGAFDTVLVRTDLRSEKDGEAPREGGSLGLYFTDDGDRTPVRIDVDTEYGRISLRLRSRERGWGPVTSGRGTRRVEP